MITQAEIIDIDYINHPTEPYQIYVPMFDGKIQDKDTNSLRWATFLSIPGITIPYAKGDKIIVAALNYNPATLIILGYLGTAENMQLVETKCNIDANNLSAANTALTTTTTIGNIDYNMLFNLFNAISILIPTIPPIGGGNK